MSDYQFQHDQSPESQKQVVDAVNSDYEFRYEQDPLLKVQATEAVKKTEWLEYLSHIKFMAGLKALWVTWFVFQIVINLWDIISPPAALPPGQVTNYKVDDIFPAFLMAVFAVSFITLLLKWQQKFSLVGKRRYLVKKPRSRYILGACLAVLPSLFIGRGTWRLRFNLGAFLFIISFLVWDLVDFRKLKSSLIARGLIDKV